MRRFLMISATIGAVCWGLLGVGHAKPSKRKAATKKQPLQTSYNIPSTVKNLLLANYKGTLKTLTRRMVAETTTNGYRIGLFVEPARQIYRWSLVKRSMKHHLVPAPRGARWLVGVLIRDAVTGAPLSGTDVSLEILDGKTKKQLSSRRLQFLWRGYPVYGMNIATPATKLPILQVTVSPFPVMRTQRTRSALLRRAVAQFPATVKRGRLVFSAKQKPVLRVASGDDVLRAVSSVKLQFKDLGPFRVGFTVVRNDSLVAWRGGKLQPFNEDSSRRHQIVVFVQDVNTGMLIPDARVEVFVYHTRRGETFRHSYPLASVFDGFPSYRYPAVFLAKTDYVVRVQIRPALHGRLSTQLPTSYEIEFDGVRLAR